MGELMGLMEFLFRKKRDFNRLRRVFPCILSNLQCDGLKQIDIELSNRCNLRYRMCWFHGENGVGDRYRDHELTSREV